VEEVTGKDMNWFFNQWFLGEGHPELDIKYQWDEKLKTQYIFVKQLQASQLFKLPIKIDVYNNNQAERFSYTLTKQVDTIKLKLNKKPYLVNVDADKILLAKK